MSIADFLVMGIVLLILALLTYVTRNKKGGGCAGCHSDCSSCLGAHSFYEEYKRDQENTRSVGDQTQSNQSSEK